MINNKLKRRRSQMGSLSKARLIKAACEELRKGPSQQANKFSRLLSLYSSSPGTLLGFIRDGTLMSHDDDVDHKFDDLEEYSPDFQSTIQTRLASSMANQEARLV